MANDMPKTVGSALARLQGIIQPYREGIKTAGAVGGDGSPEGDPNATSNQDVTSIKKMERDESASTTETNIGKEQTEEAANTGSTMTGESPMSETDDNQEPYNRTAPKMVDIDQKAETNTNIGHVSKIEKDLNQKVAHYENVANKVLRILGVDDAPAKPAVKTAAAAPKADVIPTYDTESETKGGEEDKTAGMDKLSAEDREALEGIMKMAWEQGLEFMTGFTRQQFHLYKMARSLQEGIEQAGEGEKLAAAGGVLEVMRKLAEEDPAALLAPEFAGALGEGIPDEGGEEIPPEAAEAIMQMLAESGVDEETAAAVAEAVGAAEQSGAAPEEVQAAMGGLAEEEMPEEVAEAEKAAAAQQESFRKLAAERQKAIKDILRPACRKMFGQIRSKRNGA